MNAQAIYDHTIEHGGGTFTSTGEVFAADSGYMVGGGIPTIIVPEDDAVALAEGLRTMVEQLPAGYFVGTWVHEGEIYIDASAHYAALELAVEVAQQNEELAIFNLSDLTDIAITLDTER